MSDFPKGGDRAATRAWLDNEGFNGLLVGWNADALLGADKSDIIDEIGVEKCHRLWGLLNTARQSPPQTTVASSECEELYNAFLQAEEKDGLVKLKDSKGNSLNFLIDPSDTLLIRDSARHLWTLFSKVVLDGERINKNGCPYPVNGMIIGGPEGVGKAIKNGYTVVFESAPLGQSWVLDKNGSREIGDNLLSNAPELKSAKTIHLFDAKAGPYSYEIKRIVGGAKQVVFASTNRASHAQFVRNQDVLQLFLPSTKKEEFEKYVALFEVPKVTVDEIVTISGYGKVRPLTNLEVYKSRLILDLPNFHVNNVSTSVSIENNLSDSENLAILLDAKFSDTTNICADEQDATKLYNAYNYDNGCWNFASDYIVEKIFSKFGTEAELMVEKLYFSLGSEYNRTFGPAIGRLFERCAVQRDFVARHGLICKSVQEKAGRNKQEKPKKKKSNAMILGKDCTVENYSSDKLIPISEVLKNCTDPKVIYNFAKSNEGFDCFIPPNNFIGFTQRSQQANSTAGNHPISLSFALECCRLIKEGPNFITAVPAHQADNWGEKSFIVDVQYIVLMINEKEMKSKTTMIPLQKGGQRQFKNLPPATQTELKNFRQFVGSLTMKRNMCTTARLNTFPSSLIRLSAFSFLKYI